MSAARAAGHDPGVHPPAPPETAITVCTVSFHNAPHLRLNWALADALNREEARIDWVVAENTPPHSDDRLDPGDQRFKVIEGVGPEHSPNFQHTLALHKCFDFVTTRFLLVLDPDFYIVRPNWVRTVTEHMQRHALAFLGVPWHPRFSDKYRYFPAVHCFFVDLDRIDIKELDFRPMRSDSRETPSVARSSWLTRKLGLDARRKDFTDTGTRLYHRFAHGTGARYECALPVFRLPDDAPIRRSWRIRLLERFLPDDLCYLPKRRDSYADSGLRELGFLACAPRDWEEFMWASAPLGFHVRRNARRAERDAQRELLALQRAVADFFPNEPPNGQTPGE
jgi:hypothetical protein